MWDFITHTHTHTHTYIYTHTQTYVHTYFHTYITTSIRTHTYIHTCICIYTHTHIYIHTYVRTYAHTYIHTYVHAYIHIHIHTYTCTFKHTHIHTYIYTYARTYVHACNMDSCTYKSIQYSKTNLVRLYGAQMSHEFVSRWKRTWQTQTWALLKESRCRKLQLLIAVRCCTANKWDRLLFQQTAILEQINSTLPLTLVCVWEIEQYVRNSLSTA